MILTYSDGIRVPLSSTLFFLDHGIPKKLRRTSAGWAACESTWRLGGLREWGAGRGSCKVEGAVTQ
jgi:hypothetical protein